MNKIGFNIRKVRESKGFSQEYMANVLDISQASYARLENEDTKVTVDRLQKIAEILETSIIDFFDAPKEPMRKIFSVAARLCDWMNAIIPIPKNAPRKDKKCSR